MSPTSPTDPKLHGDDRNLITSRQAVATQSFEEQLRNLWGKNGRSILIGVALVFLAVLVKEGIRFAADKREERIETDYAAALTPEKLRSFIEEHPDHSLAGVAHLALADQAYAAGRFAEAQNDYEKAVPILTQPILAGHAQLGIALSQLQNSQGVKGQELLLQISTDTKLSKALRSEALYHLASFALETGKYDDVQKFITQVMQLDQGPWAQRALGLRASVPTPDAPAAAGPNPGTGVKIKLPGVEGK